MPVTIGTGTPTRDIGALTSVAATPMTSASWTLSGSEIAILVSISINEFTGSVAVTAVTWSLGSGTPVEVASILSGDGRQRVYVIPNATAGAGTYSVTLDAARPVQITATYFTSTNTTTPCPAADAVTSLVDQSTGTHTPANLTANDASYGGAASTAANPLSAGPNQTYIDGSTAVNALAAYATGTTGITFTYDGSIPASKVAVRIVASAGAGGPTLSANLQEASGPPSYF
jgi:hypothetical protein